jgi:hypothetical protein
MFQRILQLPKKKHFFLFGARNTGKSTLIKKLYDHESSRYIDLLSSEDETRYRQNPDILASEVEALPLKEWDCAHHFVQSCWDDGPAAVAEGLLRISTLLDSGSWCDAPGDA